MINKTLLYFVATILLSCSPSSNKVEYGSSIDTIQFPFVNPSFLTSRSHSDLELDSLRKRMWMEKIMGRNNLYSATYLARFNKVSNHEIIAIETSADDWSKSFLLVLNVNLEMVDFIEVTDSYGDASQDDSGGETVNGIEARTKFISDSSFIRTRIHEMIYSYKDPKELTEKDSVTEQFIISRSGKFRKVKMDSIRIRL